MGMSSNDGAPGLGPALRRTDINHDTFIHDNLKSLVYLLMSVLPNEPNCRHLKVETGALLDGIPDHSSSAGVYSCSAQTAIRGQR